MSSDERPQATDDEVRGEARRAYGEHRWGDTFELLAGIEDRLPAEDLDRLAEAAWWTGRLERCISIRERAYEAHTRAGDRLRAAAAALGLANDYSHRLESSIASGWVRRAERLLQGIPDSPEHAYLERAYLNASLGRGDLEAALTHAERELDLAARLGNVDVEALGIHDKGRVLVAMGRVEEGLALLDEAIVAAVGGELNPFPTAVVYCNATVASQELADYRRASEWAEAAKRWCERQAISGFPGMCRVRRAEVIRLRGSWAEAEAEASRACAELQGFCLDYAGEAFYQVGEIRLKMGDVSGAEAAFNQAHQLGRDPVPGLALLRLAQGQPDAGASMVRRALQLPSATKLVRARLLPTSVELSIALGELERAKQEANELQELVQLFATHALRAAAAEAQGRVELACGLVEQAIPALEAAWRLWHEADAPYEAARARMVLGEAAAIVGDHERAKLDLDAARSTFQRLGATADTVRAGELLMRTADRSMATPAPTARRTFMFTDIVRSTNLIDVIGDDAWTNLLAWHDRTIRALLAEHGGDEVDHAGDGFFVAFRDARDAMACAVAIRRTMRDHRRGHGFAPQVRIGLHTADAKRQGTSYKGRGVHIAARIGSLAGADEILVSRDVLSAAGDAYPNIDVRLEQVRGIKTPIEIAAVLD